MALQNHRERNQTPRLVSFHEQHTDEKYCSLSKSHNHKCRHYGVRLLCLHDAHLKMYNEPLRILWIDVRAPIRVCVKCNYSKLLDKGFDKSITSRLIWEGN